MTALSAEYGQLTDELHRRAVKARTPLSGIFELTSGCNLSCRMCYIRIPAGDGGERQKELSAREWLQLAAEAKENGMLFLLLTGGEPFLRPDFFEIYVPLTRMGFIITLYSNGTLITDSVAQRLALAPPSRTEITLYGATEATYEAITGVSGGYARCCKGIEALAARRVPLLVKTTLTRQNIAELEAMKQMAANWGVPISTGGYLLSMRRDGAPSEVEQCRLPAQECVELEAEDLATAHQLDEMARRGPYSGKYANFVCYAGKASFVICSKGEMNPCIDLPKPAARPLEIGFPAAWEQVQKFVDSAPQLAAQACRSCDSYAFCPICPAYSYLWNRTLEGPVPYICEIARARKQRFENYA